MTVWLLRSWALYAFMTLLYVSVQAINNAHNVHAGVRTSPPAASWPLLALYVLLASFSMTDSDPGSVPDSRLGSGPELRSGPRLGHGSRLSYRPWLGSRPGLQPGFRSQACGLCLGHIEVPRCLASVLPQPKFAMPWSRLGLGLWRLGLSSVSWVSFLPLVLGFNTSCSVTVHILACTAFCASIAARLTCGEHISKAWFIEWGDQ